MKITGKIEGRKLRMVVENGAVYACVEREGIGTVHVTVWRDCAAYRSTHATLDAAVACAQDAVTR